MLPVRIKNYIKDVKTSLLDLDDDTEKAFEILLAAKDSGGRILCLGNGGSLSIAQHFAQDLLKLCRVRAWTINCPSILTAHANDDGFDKSFFNPAMKLLDPEDPIFIFSCSGKSPNYLPFVETDIPNPIVSIIGTDGGFLKTKSKVSIHVKSNDYQVCETAFCVIADILVKSLLEE